MKACKDKEHIGKIAKPFKICVIVIYYNRCYTWVWDARAKHWARVFANSRDIGTGGQIFTVSINSYTVSLAYLKLFFCTDFLKIFAGDCFPFVIYGHLVVGPPNALRFTHMLPDRSTSLFYPYSILAYVGNHILSFAPRKEHLGGPGPILPILGSKILYVHQ